MEGSGMKKESETVFRRIMPPVQFVIWIRGYKSNPEALSLRL